MTDFALWRRGLNGPEFVVLRDEAKMVEHDRKHRIGAPAPIAPEHVGATLDELRRLYPCPAYLEE